MRLWIICLATIALGNDALADAPEPGGGGTPVAPTSNAATEFLLSTGQVGPASLFDAVTAADPLAVPSRAQFLPRRALHSCACESDFCTLFSAEWLIGSTRGASLVPVITTGPASAGALAGTLGQPNTYPLFGGKQVLNDWRSGIRVEAGIWFDPDQRTGVSARFYSLFSERERFTALSDGTNVVDVPQFVPIGARAEQVPVFVGFPGATTGAATASARTLFLGADVNYRCLLERDDGYRIELLAGCRHLGLTDQLGAAFSAVPIGAGSSPAARLLGSDNLHTRNDFFGPQLGLCASTGWNRLVLEGHATTALGVTVSDLDYSRYRVVEGGPAGGTGVSGTAPAPNPIPLGVLTSNGTLTYFGVAAEGGVRLNWRATDQVRLISGYSFLYWNDVRRAPDMFTGGPVPRARGVDSTTHLVSAGLEVKY